METLIIGAWDLASALNNGKVLMQTLGGSLLGVMGVAAVVVAVVKAFGKVTNDQSRATWGKIIGTFLLGGMMLAGGIGLFIDIAGGAKETVDDLGGGIITSLLWRL